METNAGKILTIATTGVAIYIGYKNYKNAAFWSGILAMFLLGFTVKTYINKPE